MYIRNFMSNQNAPFIWYTSLRIWYRKGCEEMKKPVIIALCLLFCYSDCLQTLNREIAMKSIYFHLSRRNMKDKEFRIDTTDISAIPRSNRNIIMIHGWTESHLRSHYIKIKDEYLKKYDCNVIRFQYNELDQKGYMHAVEISPDLGELIAETIVRLENAGIVQLSEVHIIAHSLGCHIAGFVGKNIYRLLNEKVAKITALDAAGPLFSFVQPNKRLDRGDANHVVVIHTDTLLFGVSEAIGSLDLYFNVDKAMQPGCNAVTILTNYTTALCNHWASYKYFILTINNPQYHGLQCGSSLFYLLGVCRSNHRILYTEDISSSITGTYFLTAKEAIYVL